MWISKGEYRRLVRAALRAERRIDQLTEDLTVERAENRRAERHWADMLLRAKQTYPLPAKPTAVPVPADSPLEPAGIIPGMDDGEVEALIATGATYGMSRDDAIRSIKQARGLE